MVSERTWEEFKTSGLLWWTNRMLHLFGWAIVLEYSDENKFTRVYPARVKFRGFTEVIEDKGFKDLSEYLVNNAESLRKDCDE